MIHYIEDGIYKKIESHFAKVYNKTSFENGETKFGIECLNCRREYDSDKQDYNVQCENHLGAFINCVCGHTIDVFIADIRKMPNIDKSFVRFFITSYVMKNARQRNYDCDMDTLHNAVTSYTNEFLDSYVDFLMPLQENLEAYCYEHVSQALIDNMEYDEEYLKEIAVIEYKESQTNEYLLKAGMRVRPYSNGDNDGISIEVDDKQHEIIIERDENGKVLIRFYEDEETVEPITIRGNK